MPCHSRVQPRQDGFAAGDFDGKKVFDQAEVSASRRGVWGGRAFMRCGESANASSNKTECKPEVWGRRLQPRCWPHKRRLNTKLHLAVNARGMPVRVLLQKCITADCTQASKLIEGINAEYMLADKGYDSDEIIKQGQKQGMIVVILPRKNRKVPREYDKDLYKLRHLVENAFPHLKRWRGIATRYAKNAKSFLVAVQIRCLAFWRNIS
jgi:transposase